MPLADAPLADWRARELRADTERDDVEAIAITTRIQQNSCGTPRGIRRDTAPERWGDDSAFVNAPFAETVKRRAAREALVIQRIAVGHLLRIGPVERVTKFAAVNFGVRTGQRFHFFRVIVPALQVSRAEFAFRVAFIAGALLVLAHLDLDFFLGRGGSVGGSGSGGLRNRCGSGWTG